MTTTNTNTIEINATISTDTLGSYEDNEFAQAAFAEALESAWLERFPEAEIDIDFTGNSGASRIELVCDDEAEDEIRQTLKEIQGRVWDGFEHEETCDHRSGDGQATAEEDEKYNNGDKCSICECYYWNGYWYVDLEGIADWNAETKRWEVALSPEETARLKGLQSALDECEEDGGYVVRADDYPVGWHYACELNPVGWQDVLLRVDGELRWVSVESLGDAVHDLADDDTDHQYPRNAAEIAD